jgi:5-formyltetrahydrofolate cyclo-ligase
MAGRTDPLEGEKRALREAMRERRRVVLASESLEAGERAAALLDEQLHVWRPKMVLLYAALSGEADPQAIDRMLRRRNIGVAYPRVGAGRTLKLHLAELGSLVAGRFPIREPDPNSPTVAASEIDLAVVPGLAFDTRGGRLGFGRGYYDVFLSQAPRAIRLGLCMPWQVVPRVPTARHDVLLDFLLGDALTATSVRPLPRSTKEVTP